MNPSQTDENRGPGSIGPALVILTRVTSAKTIYQSKEYAFTPLQSFLLLPCILLNLAFLRSLVTVIRTVINFCFESPCSATAKDLYLSPRTRESWSAMIPQADV